MRELSKPAESEPAGKISNATLLMTQLDQGQPDGWTRTEGDQ